MVREKSTHLEVIERVMETALCMGFDILNLEYSPIRGPEGNIEYLVHLYNHGETDVSGLERAAHNLVENLEEIVDAAHESLCRA